jgi:hypothetical protein
MASSKELWYSKLKSWVPQWFFEEIEHNEAVFMGIAAVLEKLECSLDDHIRETYICQAVDGYLDEHGLERNITRISGEFDSQLRERIKNITNTTSCDIIKTVVDALLDVGESIILEDFNASIFFDREDAFYNRGDLLIDPIYNAFSIIVDNQKHAPYSFFDRENFYDREDFIGLNESQIALFELIVEHVNASKALGIAYRLVERVE